MSQSFHKVSDCGRGAPALTGSAGDVIQSAEIFPLPMTPFEYYYWSDDRPEYPTSFPIDLHFLGHLNRSAFEQATALAIERHPLLRAIVKPQRLGLPHWVAAATRTASLEWNESEPLQPPGKIPVLDLSLSPGLHMQVQAMPEQTHVRIWFHHACCDGLGALQFIEELLLIYDAHLRGTDVQQNLRPLEAERLRMRGDYGNSTSNVRPTLRDVWITACIWARRLFRRCTPIAATHRGHSPTPAPPQPFYVSRMLNKAEVAQLWGNAAASGATLNDLMLVILLKVLQQWNEEHGSAARQRFVINVPVNLRHEVDLQMPAANSLGFWFIERTTAQLQNFAALLHSIQSEMSAVKKWRLPLYFIAGLQIAAKIPGLMRGILRSKKSFATVVFSNLGRVFSQAPLTRQDSRLVCGDVILEHISGVPPIRPGTRISIAALTYGDELSMHLRFDTNYLTAEDGTRLLDRFREELLSSGVRSPQS